MPVGVVFCRTLVDEWVRAGVTDAVVSPGSRSTPLTVALAERVATHVVLDERAAAFTALGLARATGRPTVVACTSGTAPTHFHGAVAEADRAAVPLLVCTADRPPALHDVGAPQTFDQTRLYGTAVRWFTEPGPPDRATAATWRSLGARAVAEATGARPGPVHLNLAFDEPLLDGMDEACPPGRADGGPWHRTGSTPTTLDAPSALAEVCRGAQRPLVIAGDGSRSTLGLRGVPVLSDHRGPLTGTVAHWDLLVRDRGFIDAHRPDLVVRLGLAPASKPLARWLAGLDVPQVALCPPGRWIDADRIADWVLDRPVALDLAGSDRWERTWREAGEAAAAAVDAVLGSTAEVSEPEIARRVLATRLSGSSLVVSSSMPVRDLEAFAAPRGDVRVHANRGVNGIDGVVSTALGVALSGAPTTLLIGDLALLHDQGALTGLTARGVDLDIVVVDNGGGGIFSFLPQHDLLEGDRFEMLFGTPQPVEIADLFAVHGIPTTTVVTTADLEAALVPATGVRAIVARTDRERNVALHDELAAAVSVAIAR